MGNHPPGMPEPPRHPAYACGTWQGVSGALLGAVRAGRWWTNVLVRQRKRGRRDWSMGRTGAFLLGCHKDVLGDARRLEWRPLSLKCAGLNRAENGLNVRREKMEIKPAGFKPTTLDRDFSPADAQLGPFGNSAENDMPVTRRW